MYGQLPSGARCLNNDMNLYLHHYLYVRAEMARTILYTCPGASEHSLFKDFISIKTLKQTGLFFTNQAFSAGSICTVSPELQRYARTKYEYDDSMQMLRGDQQI